MITVLFVLHILICTVLVAVVLLQAGRGGGLSGAFGGGGGGQALFGGRGAATFLNKATVALGGLFFATSLVLALMSAHGTSTRKSLIQEEAGRARPTAGPPASPARPGVPATGGSTRPGGAAPAGQAPAAPNAPSQGAPAPGAQQPPANK